MREHRSVLLVEDDPHHAALAQRAFARAGVTRPLAVARDGVEALELLGADARAGTLPALVLLDLQLPRVDGLEVLRRLRADPGLVALPVVVLTTSAEPRDVVESYRLGANGYVCKPIDFGEFTAAIATLAAYWLELNHVPGRDAP